MANPIFLIAFVALTLLCLFPLGVFAVVCKLFGHLDSHRTVLAISIIVGCIAITSTVCAPTGDPLGFAQGFFRTQLPIPTFAGVALIALSVWIAPIRNASHSKMTISTIFVWVTGLSCLLAVIAFTLNLISDFSDL